MRIALLAPLYESVPPKLYGGTERVVANLSLGLSNLGHEVTLFASGDSETKNTLISPIDTGLRLSGVPKELHAPYHLAQLSQVIKMRHTFDVIHNHNEFFGLPLASIMDTPVLTTLHGRLDDEKTIQLFRKEKSCAYVSISDHQRKPLPDLNWVATIHHGIPIENFKYEEKPGSYLAFLGRISPEKRPDLAIEIAKASGTPLKIAAKVDPADLDYYNNVVKPMIDGSLIEYIGEIGEHEKSAFLGGALGLLFPIEWPEPFGLAPVEAWATGTPVLARPFGAIPEIHRDGVTGYIRKDAASLAHLVKDLQTFDRSQCRKYAENYFGLSRMCEEYVHVYRELIYDHKRKSSQENELSQTDCHRWSVLHSIERRTYWDRKDRIEE